MSLQWISTMENDCVTSRPPHATSQKWVNRIEMGFSLTMTVTAWHLLTRPWPHRTRAHARTHTQRKLFIYLFSCLSLKNFVHFLFHSALRTLFRCPMGHRELIVRQTTFYLFCTSRTQVVILTREHNAPRTPHTNDWSHRHWNWHTYQADAHTRTAKEDVFMVCPSSMTKGEFQDKIRFFPDRFQFLPFFLSVCVHQASTCVAVFIISSNLHEFKISLVSHLGLRLVAFSRHKSKQCEWRSVLKKRADPAATNGKRNSKFALFIIRAYIWHFFFLWLTDRVTRIYAIG